MKVPIYKVSCIVIGSKCAVTRSTSQLVDVAALCAKLRATCPRLGLLSESWKAGSRTGDRLRWSDISSTSDFKNRFSRCARMYLNLNSSSFRLFALHSRGGATSATACNAVAVNRRRAPATLPWLTLSSAETKVSNLCLTPMSESLVWDQTFNLRPN